MRYPPFEASLLKFKTRDLSIAMPTGVLLWNSPDQAFFANPNPPFPVPLVLNGTGSCASGHSSAEMLTFLSPRIPNQYPCQMYSFSTAPVRPSGSCALLQM